METIDNFLLEREKAGLLRTLVPVSGRHDGKIVVQEKEFYDLSSNDYLGLSRHPRLINAGQEALAKWGVGSGASRLMTGDLSLHHDLEEKTAFFKKKEAALVFNSGYQANVGILSAVLSTGDCVFSDRLNHASLIDGILLSGARIIRFRHNDIEHLEALLATHRSKYRKSLIVTETVFSMDGDKPPLEDLVRLKEKYDCIFLVDEAHATGIFGPSGSGVVEEAGLSEEIDFIMGTFSKGLGSFGAYVALSRKMKEYLVNTCRSFIYSTSLPAGVIACNIAALDIVREEPWRRKNLLEAALFLRHRLRALGLNVLGMSQILPVVIGGNKETLELSASLREKGWWTLAVRPPTVPAGAARLRLSLNVFHTCSLLEKFSDDLCQSYFSIFSKRV